jgi:UDP-N-acetylmuramoyl-L-alanyl-D-glutamate--2,6-diaminopimelate ligase
MDAYAAAKARLFDTEGLACAVLNLDDVFGAQLAARLHARGVRTLGYSLVSAPATGEFLLASAQADGRVEFTSTWGEAHATLRALGRFNLSNALGVAGALIAYGLPFRDAIERLDALPEVPGRMQRLGGEDAPLVVVDDAHTPDALAQVLGALRPIAAARGGRLIVVFGAGGERDRAKRAPMGEAASRLADRVVLTSDNPRGEDPDAILREIEAGMNVEHDVEPDRARAIEAAIARAGAADVLLLAGKGHEATQEIAGVRTPFSDAEVARNALARRARR